MTTATFHSNIRAGIRQRLQELAGLPTVEWEGISFVPTKGTPWVTETVVPVSSVVTATGAGGLIAHTLTANFTLHYPSNTGTLEIDAKTGALLEHFRPGTAINYSGDSAVVQQAEPARLLQEPDWINRTIIVTMVGHTTN